MLRCRAAAEVWGSPAELHDCFALAQRREQELLRLPSCLGLGGEYVRRHVIMKLLFLDMACLRWKKCLPEEPTLEQWQGVSLGNLQLCADQGGHLADLPANWSAGDLWQTGIEPHAYAMQCCLWNDPPAPWCGTRLFGHSFLQVWCVRLRACRVGRDEHGARGERDHVTSACVLRIGVHGADVVEGLLKNRSAMEAARDCYKAEHGMEPCPAVLVAAALGAGSAMRKRPAALKGPGGRASKRPAQCV